jgi:hypothetical protein
LAAEEFIRERENFRRRSMTAAPARQVKGRLPDDQKRTAYRNEITYNLKSKPNYTYTGVSMLKRRNISFWILVTG